MEIEITKMTSKGQIVIPQDIREEARLQEGEKFFVYELKGDIVLKRIKNMHKIKNLDELEKVFASLWKTARIKGITEKDVVRELAEYRKQKHA